MPICLLITMIGIIIIIILNIVIIDSVVLLHS